MENSEQNKTVKFFSGKQIPLEMHKVRVVQALNLKPVERRIEAIREAGYNSFLLHTKDLYLDMLTDSGTNAMSDEQISKMFVADDAYAGSGSFSKFEKSVLDVLGQKYVLPVHQGRAAENIISQAICEGRLCCSNELPFYNYKSSYHVKWRTSIGVTSAGSSQYNQFRPV